MKKRGQIYLIEPQVARLLSENRSIDINHTMKAAHILILTILLAPTFGYSYVGAGHVSGAITNITSTNSGLLLRIGANETPQTCTSSSVWMEIKKEKTVMISMAITAWTLRRNVAVYTSPASSGYCQVGQVDPSEP